MSFAPASSCRLCGPAGERRLRALPRLAAAAPFFSFGKCYGRLLGESSAGITTSQVCSVVFRQLFTNPLRLRWRRPPARAVLGTSPAGLGWRAAVVSFSKLPPFRPLHSPSLHASSYRDTCVPLYQRGAGVGCEPQTLDFPVLRYCVPAVSGGHSEDAGWCCVYLGIFYFISAGQAFIFFKPTYRFKKGGI